METKRCRKCGENKPLDGFYPHPLTVDGLLGSCKECKKAYEKAHHAEARIAKSEYNRKRQRDPDRRKRKMAYLKKHRTENPEKYKARQAVGNAIRDGRLLRLPCKECGNPKSEAHHGDYSKPLDVEWLCFKCHREAGHNQVIVVH